MSICSCKGETMFNNSEKKDFINIIIANQFGDINCHELKSQILNKLYAETNNGKMYKYRCVNEYSLANLKDETLYCAVPSSFNDPFDCKFGIELETLVSEKYGSVFMDTTLCFKKFLDIYKGGASLEECTERERQVISRWLSNKELCRFVEQQIALKNEKLLIESIDENIDIILNIFNTCSKNDDFIKQIECAKPIIGEIFEHMNEEQKLEMLKGDSSLKDFAWKMGIKEDVDEITRLSLLNQRLCPSQVENAELSDKKLGDIYRNLAQIIDNTYRVGCLCTDNKNNLMWSHYANGHRGFCIEYDFNSPCDEKNELCILPVIYSSERMRFPWKLVLEIQKEKTDIHREIAYAVMEALVTKDILWSYENEWRIIISEKTGIKNVKMPPITCIYIGALCSEEDRILLKDIAKEISVPIKQMVVDRGEYTLHAIDC